MRNLVLIFTLFSVIVSCKDETKNTKDDASEDIKDEMNDSLSVSELKSNLVEKGFQVFDYVDEKTQDTVLMQQYFIAFLKSGPIRNQNEEEASRLQNEHLAHLTKMYELGYADISGPFADNGDIRGITIYNVPTFEMADSLAKSDPMVRAGRLIIETHPWWAAKGYALR
ncbi:MAG: hypothetical protein HKN40_11415 [Winogradskyella sp.]|uniref:YciI family protein n=1 Tax=Winogradskyella sp. TaxID=1883156 RepID=UPI0017B3EF42|nr:hypothetical protein [Winogradskyella sp.]